VVESLLRGDVSSTISPELSSLFVTDHEEGIRIAVEVRVAAATFLQSSSVLLQDERVIIVPQGIMHSWVISLPCALYRHPAA